MRFRTRLVIALTAGLFVLAPSAMGSTSPPSPQDAEAEFTELVNAERSDHGVASVAVAADLVDVARRHAERMAAEGRLYHNPNLGNEVQNWQTVGENVGTGPTVDEIHRAFMASGSHRSVILDGTFKEIGVGVAVRGETIWVAQVFRDPAPAPAPAPARTEPRPEPERASRATAAAPPPAPVAKPAPVPAPVAAPAPAAPVAPVAPDLAALNAFQAPADEGASQGTVVLSDALAVGPLPSPDEIPLPVKVAASMLVAVVAAQVATAWRYRLVTLPARA